MADAEPNPHDEAEIDEDDPHAPRCLKCGHVPCPACVTWCDTILTFVTCPACAEHVREYDYDDPARPQEGQQMTCPHCGKQWALRLPPGDETKGSWTQHDLDTDTCCDMECEWDRPMEEVVAWCDGQTLPPLIPTKEKDNE